MQPIIIEFEKNGELLRGILQRVNEWRIWAYVATTEEQRASGWGKLRLVFIDQPKTIKKLPT